MKIDRRTFTKSLAAGTTGSLLPAAAAMTPDTARARTPQALARTESRLPPAIITNT